MALTIVFMEGLLRDKLFEQPVPVFDSCGISPSPYLSLSLIFLIFNKVISWFLASRSQYNVNAALLRANVSYFTIVSNSSRSQILLSEYGLSLLVLLFLTFMKEGVIHSDSDVSSEILPLHL